MDTQDQAQTLTYSYDQFGVMAQTFTAGMTGLLDRVSLASDTPYGFTILNVGIETLAADGTPSGTVLGSNTFRGSFTGAGRQFHDFLFSPGVPITAGTHYAIVVKAYAGGINWYDSSWLDAYPGGQLYVSCFGCAWFSDPSYGQDFAFKTWVATNTNQAPALTANSSAITVTEGTAPTNTGSYSDPDGDTVTISASSGTLTRTGTSGGAWTWTAPASDEAPTQTVNLTADDGRGFTSTTSFTVTVITVTPTAVITNDPPSSPEGTPIDLTASATSPAATDNAFNYSWAVTKDGSPFATGAGGSFIFTPNDEGTYVATLRATDDGGISGTSSFTVVGTNVAPTAKIDRVTASAPLVLTAQESVNFAGSFSDPGVMDSHAVSWNFGDGTPAGTSSYGPGGTAAFSTSHTYTAAGTYNVTLTVNDDDGASGQATARVLVQTPQQALAAIAARVQGITTLNAGQKNSLTAKLQAAIDAIGRGNTTAANNQLNAFLNEVQADAGAGKLSSTDAADLRTAIHAVQAALGVYNRLLQWWTIEA
jgi:hypothetical protein